MPKTYPARWTTREVAYFAGIISALIATANLQRIVDECAARNQDHALYFTDLVERLEPRIPENQWNSCVEICERIFGGNHAKPAR